MTVALHLAALFSIASKPAPLYRQALERFQVLEAFGILETRRRAEHFCAQLLHESGGGRVMVENLNYSAKRLTQVWPRRFPTLEDALPFAHEPRLLANQVYGGRLGNVHPDDGWRFIGRGFLQLTGRSNYERIGEALGIDLVQNPDFALLPEYSLKIAGQVWRSAGCHVHADADDILKVTRAINGGYVGLEDRTLWLAKIRHAGVVVEAVRA